MGRQRKLKQFDRQASQLMTQTMKNAKAHSIIAADNAMREAVTLAEAVGLEDARDMLAFTLVERVVRGDR